MTPIEVEIMGQSYRLTAPAEGSADLLAAVGQVDLAMCKIRDAGKIKARDRIAVLACINLAYELNAARQKISQQPETPAPNGQAMHVHTWSEEEQQMWADVLNRLDEAVHHDGKLL
jgi:cell division protein ZapA